MILRPTVINYQLTIIHCQRLIQPLPDVTLATAMDGRIALTSYIYINKVAFLHLQRLQLHRQLPHPALTQRHARLLQRAQQAAGRLGCTLHGPEVHDSLVEH